MINDNNNDSVLYCSPKAVPATERILHDFACFDGTILNGVLITLSELFVRIAGMLFCLACRSTD